jgi:hypothetical protein
MSLSCYAPSSIALGCCSQSIPCWVGQCARIFIGQASAISSMTTTARDLRGSAITTRKEWIGGRDEANEVRRDRRELDQGLVVNISMVLLTWRKDGDACIFRSVKIDLWDKAVDIVLDGRSFSHSLRGVNNTTITKFVSGCVIAITGGVRYGSAWLSYTIQYCSCELSGYYFIQPLKTSKSCSQKHQFPLWK